VLAHWYFHNGIDGVMANVLASSTAYHEFESWSGQNHDYKMCMCCFSTKHAALRRKSKELLARNQDNAWYAVLEASTLAITPSMPLWKYYCMKWLNLNQQDVYIWERLSKLLQRTKQSLTELWQKGDNSNSLFKLNGRSLSLFYGEDLYRLLPAIQSISFIYE
jgi:hypothetical protein